MSTNSAHVCKTDPNLRPQPTRTEAEYQAVVIQRDDLLAALRECMEATNDVRIYSLNAPWDRTGPAVIKARAAIAKAVQS